MGHNRDGDMADYEIRVSLRRLQRGGPEVAPRLGIVGASGACRSRGAARGAILTMRRLREPARGDRFPQTFEDRRVCKPHLLGLCVHDRFFNTTLDQGACPSEACGEAADKFRKQ